MVTDRRYNTKTINSINWVIQENNFLSDGERRSGLKSALLAALRRGEPERGIYAASTFTSQLVREVRS
jgi:hypothetical protein